MPPKNKNKTRRARPAVRFTVRRIANRNPRNARNFRRFRRKLSRVSAGLFVLILLASGMFLSGGNLRTEILAPENSNCAATELAANFGNWTTQLANLSREFPELVDNLDFCSAESCAAEDLIYENETEIWQLEKDLSELETTSERARADFAATLAEAENEVLFCANESNCTAAETALESTRDCEKEFQNLADSFATRAEVRGEYLLATEKGTRKSAAEYTKKLIETIFAQREIANKNSANYKKCVAASDASVCQKYSEKAENAETKIRAAIAELGNLKIGIDAALDEIADDIVALEIGKKDAANFEKNEGAGWCAEKLKTAKNNLAEKITRGADKKTEYETALANLETAKAELRASAPVAVETATAEKTAVIFDVWTALDKIFTEK